MVAAYQTLKKRQDFVRIQHSRLKVATKGLVLCMASEPDDVSNRPSSSIHVGFTVTKTVGNSVERNRVRRRLRALVQEILPHFSQTNTAYVLIGRKAALERDYEGLKKDLRYALHTLHKQHTKMAS